VWASSASEEERFTFLGQFLDCFKYEERKKVQGKVNAVWKRKTRNLTKTALPVVVSAPVPVSSKEVPVSAAVPVSSQEVPVSAAVPESSREEPNTLGWWRDYNETNIVALDCEFVELKTPHPNIGIKNIAAEVTIVNFNKDIIYSVNLSF